MNFLDGYGYTPHNLDMPDFGKDAEKIEADEPVVPIARPGTTLPEPDGFSGAVGALARGFETGYIVADEGLTWHRVKEKEIELDDKFLKRSAQNDRKMGAYQTTYEDSWLFQGSQFLGTMAGSFKDPTMAATSATAGALSMTGVGTAITAPLMLAGIYSSSSKIEGGNAYKTLIQEKVPDSIARDLADQVGMINGSIEAVGTLVLGKAVSPLLRSMVAKYAPKHIKGLAPITPGYAAAASIKGLGIGVVEEVLTETFQEVVTAYSEEKAKSIGALLKDPATEEEIYDRLWDTAVSTFKGAATLGLLGGGFTAHMYYGQVKQAKAGADFFGNLNGAAQDIKEARNPYEAARSFIATQMGKTEDNEQHTVYVRADEFSQAMQEAGVTIDELRAAFPDVAKKLETALENGGDVEMEAETFAQSIAGSPLGMQLQQHARLDPSAPSYAEAVRVAQEYRAMQKDLIKHTFTSEEEADKFLGRIENSELKKKSEEIVDRLQSQIVAANPRFKPSEARAQAKMAAAMVINLAKRANIPVDKIDALVPQVVAGNTPGGGDGLSQAADDSLYQKRTKAEPKNTVKVYKLMRIMRDENGQVKRDANGQPLLYALFIDSATPIEMGTWYDAESPEMRVLQTLPTGIHLCDNASDNTMTFAEYVAAHPEVKGRANRTRPGKADIKWATDHGMRFMEIKDASSSDAKRASKRYGDARRYYNLGLNGPGAVTPYALRAGWHAASAPSMRQIAVRNSVTGAMDIRADDMVWVEGEMPADIDYQTEADATADGDLATKMPTDGFYRFYTNADKSKRKAGLDWMIGGAFRPTRIISDAEARSVIDQQNAELGAEIPYDYGREGGRNFNAETMEYDEPAGDEYLQRVSTALPSKAQVKKGEYPDPAFVRAWASYSEALKNSEFTEKVAAALLALPGMKGAANGKGGLEAIEPIIERMADNLVWLFSKIPEEKRDRARKWYDGGHKAAVAWAERYGLYVRQTAAVIAIFSPQNGWFNNMTNAERLLDIYFGARRSKPNSAHSKALREACLKEEEFKYADIRGKTLEQLISEGNLRAAALWVRTYDAVHNPSSYNVLTPEGGVGGKELTDKGAEKRAFFMGTATIAKALSVIVDGSVANISEKIGTQFKVRDFYNNIYDPSNINAVTVDTHAVGADTLSVVSSVSQSVKENFGSIKNAASGQNGTYPFHFEAYRRAAERCGVSPREMQSITWEAIRVLFESDDKNELRQPVEEIWAAHDRGEITADEARDKIFDVAGGFSEFAWEKTPFTDKITETYDRKHVKLYDDITPPKSEPVLTFEVAPDPKDAEAVAMWDQLTPEDKLAVTQEVAPWVLEQIAAQTQTYISEPVLQRGGYLGTSNYSLLCHIADGGDYVKAGRLLASYLRQESVMAISPDSGEGMFESKIIRISLPGYTTEQIDDLYVNYVDKVRDKNGERLIVGHSTAEGVMLISVDAKNIDEIKAGLDKQFATLKDPITYGVDDAYTGFLEPFNEQEKDNADSRDDSGREGGIRQEASAGYDANLQSATDALVKEAIQRRIERKQDDGSASVSGGDRGQRQTVRSGLPLRDGALSDKSVEFQTAKHYGKPIPGSTSVLGFHFSSEGRDVLDSSFYGTGLRGREAERLSDAANQDIRHRTFFYADADAGVIPERGVGTHIHVVHLDNVYNTSEDPLGIVAEANAKGENVERTIMQAGFDGYYIPYVDSWQQGAVCLVGEHKVEVEQKGTFTFPPGNMKPGIKGTYVNLFSNKLNPEQVSAIKDLQSKYGYRVVQVSKDGSSLNYPPAAEAEVKAIIGDDVFAKLKKYGNVYDGRTYQQTAFHGTGATFDAFSLDHVGEGTGKATHGYGLYFTADRKVAEKYSNMVADDNGNVYEVDVPEDDELIDEEATISEQPERVRDAIQELFDDEYGFEIPRSWNGRMIYQQIILFEEGFQEIDDVPDDYLIDIENDELAGNAQLASERLNSLGIKGLRFTGDDGDKSFVIWDEKSIKKLDFKPDEKLIERAVENFGTTKNTKEAFYILPDGRMLDGSGRHWGADERDIAGQRQVDHQDITEVIDDYDSPSDAMYKWMGRTGAMRFDQIVGIASVARKPTPEQLKILKKVSKGKYLALSLQTPEGRIVDDAEFDHASPDQIDEFFEEALEKAAQGVQGAYAQTDDARGSFSPSRNTVTLGAQADLSTFSHEMGHWYLENLFKMARMEGVDATVLEDVQTMLDTFGLKSVEEWEALDHEHKTKLHERFAYSVELYLATGRAPTKQTQGFFSRLGSWIRGVYRRYGGVETSLGETYRQLFNEELPPISPEVKRVMDRMIASEENMVEAERVVGFTPLFEKKPEGMSDEDWNALQRDRDEAFNAGTERLTAARARDEKWVNNARSRKLREIQRKGKEIRKKGHAQVVIEVEKRPEIIAYDALRTGGKALGIDNLRMDPDSLKYFGIGDETIEKLKAMHVCRKGGLSPEDTRKLLYPVARFKSVKRMISALLTAADKDEIIEKEVELRCKERHSEFFDPVKMDRLVTEALITEARARMLATELKYLAGKDGLSSSVYVEAARRAAADMLADMPLAKVSAKRFMMAAAAASRKAFAALAKGNREEAIRQKRIQMVNHQAALLAMDLEKGRRKFDDLRKFAFRTDKKLSAGYDLGVIAYLRAILVQTGNGPKGVDPSEATRYLLQVSQYADDKQREKYARYQTILDQHSKVRIEPGKMTVAQFQQILEDIQGLKRLAIEEKTLLLDGRRMEVEDAVDELVAQLESLKLKPVAFGVNRAVSDNERRTKLLYTIKAFVSRVESWCASADAGNEGKPFQKYIFRPIAQAAAKYRVENMHLQKALNDIIRPLMDNWANVRDIEFKDKAGRVIYTFDRKAEFIGAMLHTGNDSNKKKLLLGGRGDEGLPWGAMVEQADGSQVFDSSDWDNFVRQAAQTGILTLEDMKAIQAIWDLLEGTKPIIQKAYFEYYGMYFKEIEATPFTLPLGANGQELAFRGGYVPAVADPDVHEDQVAFDKKELMDQADFFEMFPVTRPGFSHERTNATRPLRLNVGLVGSHIQKAMKFAMIAPAALQVQKILRDPAFKAAVNAVDRKAINEMFAPWLKRSVEQTVGTPTTEFGRWLNRMRGLAGMNLMAGNFVNALQQTTGLSVALSKVGVENITNALFTLMQSPRQVVKDVMEKSVFMKARLEDRAFEFQTELERIASPQDPKKLDQLRDFISSKAYILQTVTQQYVDVPVWLAAYNKAIAEGRPEEDAIGDADSAVRTTQSAFDPETVSRVETGSPLWRSLLVFYNYFNMQLNLLGERWMVARQTKRYGRFAADAVLVVVIPAILSEIMAGAFSGFDTGDDDDWDAVDSLNLMTSAVGRNIVAMIPMGGNVLNVFGTNLAKSDVPGASEAARWIFGRNPYNDRLVSVPIMTLVEGAAKAPGQIFRASEGEGSARAATRGFLDLVAVATGLPAGSLKKPVGYAAGVASGEIEPEGPLDVIRGVISGKDASK